MSNIPFNLNGKRIWVAGHTGLLGSALVRALKKESGADLLLASRAELDLREYSAVLEWVTKKRPDVVFLPAGKVGGIMANTEYPVDFLDDNLSITANCIRASQKRGVKKLLFVASSAIYPEFADQPIVEEAMLTGPIEPTHEGYAIAKIAGIKLCQAYRKQFNADFISCVPTNLYGPSDKHDLQKSHFIPALIRKAATAKREGAASMEIWGTGKARRDILHVDDCAEAMVHIMKTYSASPPINIGTGKDMSVEEIAKLIMKVVGFDGELVKDLSKPDGAASRLMNINKLKELGWEPRIDMEAGLSLAYEAYKDLMKLSVKNAYR